MRPADRALRIIERQGHATGIEVTDNLLFGTTYRPVCLEDDCGWRGGAIGTLARAHAIGDEHHDKTAGDWGPAR